MSSVLSSASTNWLPAECLSGLGLSDPGTALWISLGFVASWFAVRAANAIFNEYVKRFWIKHVHPDEIAAAKAEVKKLEVRVLAERQEIDEFRSNVAVLIEKGERLSAEIIRLRQENALLRSETMCLKEAHAGRKTSYASFVDTSPSGSAKTNETAF